MLEHGLLAEGAFRAEVTDLQRLLLGQAGRHDFAEQPHQHFVGELPARAIDRGRLAALDRLRAVPGRPGPGRHPPRLAICTQSQFLVKMFR